MVARATERQLEQNALYMRIKMSVTSQATEITKMRESSAKIHEENIALKERCATIK